MEAVAQVDADEACASHSVESACSLWSNYNSFKYMRS
jgi:hypothetical protein